MRTKTFYWFVGFLMILRHPIKRLVDLGQVAEFIDREG